MSPAAALILEMQIYPIIRNTIPRKAKPMGSEDYQELVQDTTATAAAMIDAMEKSGKQRLYGVVPSLKDELAANKNVLELDCCTFRFDKLPR